MDINNFKIYRSNNLLVYLYFELLSQSRCFLMRYDINKDFYELNHSKSTNIIFLFSKRKTHLFVNWLSYIAVLLFDSNYIKHFILHFESIALAIKIDVQNNNNKNFTFLTWNYSKNYFSSPSGVVKVNTLNIIIFSSCKYVFAINQQSTSIRLSEWTLENCKNNFMFAQD